MNRATWVRLAALMAVMGLLAGAVRAARSRDSAGDVSTETAAGGAVTAVRTTGARAADGPAPTPAARDLGPTFILLRAEELTPEARLNFMGQGFAPGETVTVALEDAKGKAEAELEAVNAEKEGRINEVSLALPPGLRLGSHVLRVKGGASGRTARATFRLRGVPPRVELDQYSVKPDREFGFAGSGFVPDEQVEVRVGGLGGAPLATFTADRGGAATGRIKAPPIQAGDYPLYFVGRESQNPVSVGLNVQGFAPFVILDNYAARPYERMGFRGEDFAAGEQVLVYLNKREGEPLTHVQADATGKLNVKAALELPALRGDNTLIFVAGQTGAVIEAKFAVLPFAPSLELTAYAGRPGTPVQLIGSHFARGESLRVVVGEKDQKREVASLAAGPDGTFKNAGGFRVPVKVGPGAVPVTVIGSVSQVETTVYFDVLKLQPSAELSAYDGPAGTVVSFTGRGFAGGERVTVHLKERTGPVLASATAGDTGTFQRAGSYPVEGDAGGDAVPFVLVGEESGAEATTHFRIDGR